MSFFSKIANFHCGDLQYSKKELSFPLTKTFIKCLDYITEQGGLYGRNHAIQSRSQTAA